MDRTKYIQIRNSLNLEKDSSAFSIHFIENIFLVVSALLIWRYFQDSWMRLIMILPLFCLMFRGFGIMHDAVHGAVSRTRWLNDLAGFVGGVFCMLPYENWKRSHLKHHQWSGNVEKDPVMALIIFYPKFPKMIQNLISFFWMLWFPVLALFQHFVFWNLSVKLLMKEPKSFKMAACVVLPLITWGVVFFTASTLFLTGVLLPTLLVYFLAVEVVNFPHHLQLPQFRGEVKFPVWQQYQTARSCVYPKWVARFVVLNFNYHIEHHMFPDVPWYHLDKLHEPVRKALQDEYNTDPSFGWILKNKKLNVGEVLSPADKEQKPFEAKAV